MPSFDAEGLYLSLVKESDPPYDAYTGKRKEPAEVPGVVRIQIDTMTINPDGDGHMNLRFFNETKNLKVPSNEKADGWGIFDVNGNLLFYQFVYSRPVKPGDTITVKPDGSRY